MYYTLMWHWFLTGNEKKIILLKSGLIVSWSGCKAYSIMPLP